jgi:hypothetical protein
VTPRSRHLAPLLAVVLLGARPGSAAPPTRSASEPAPDLEIVALQTTGPGRIGACNAVLARLHNAGDAATSAPPAVRLDVTGARHWTRTARAGAPLAPADTVEIWFENVPLEARLSQLETTADPEDLQARRG